MAVRVLIYLQVPTDILAQKSLNDDFASRDKSDNKNQEKKKHRGDGNFNKNRYEKDKGKRKRGDDS